MGADPPLMYPPNLNTKLLTGPVAELSGKAQSLLIKIDVGVEHPVHVDRIPANGCTGKIRYGHLRNHHPNSQTNQHDPRQLLNTLHMAA